MVPDKSDLNLHCLLTRLQKYFNKRQEHTIFIALTLNKCDSQFIYGHDFHEVVTMRLCAAQTTYQIDIT